MAGTVYVESELNEGTTFNIISRFECKLPSDDNIIFKSPKSLNEIDAENFSLQKSFPQ